GDIMGKLIFTPTEDHDFEVGAGYARIRREAEPNRTLEAGDSPTRADHDRWHWSASHEGRWEGFTTDFHVTQEWAQRTRYDHDPVTDDFVENPRAPLIRNTVVEGKATVPFDALGEHI